MHIRALAPKIRLLTASNLLILLILFCSVSQAAPEADPFKLNVSVQDPNTLKLTWQMVPDVFLYKKRFKFQTMDAALGPIRYPKTMTKVDSQKQTHPIYRKEVSLFIPLLFNQTGSSHLTVGYQGCADSGFCYPPQTAQIKLTVDKELGMSKATIFLPTKPQEPTTETASINESSTAEQALSDGRIAFAIISFLLLGLLLAFTPCVLPMVPVLSGIIVGHQKNLTTKKAFLLSLSYVLGMSFTYAIVGIVIALVGHNLQTLMQSVWAIGLFSLLFVLLALSMFGLYELKLPTKWQSLLAKESQSHQGHGYIGALIMGALSTLILSPCVTAPLVGVLSYIANTGNAFLGAVALFSLGIGMGLPLLVIGTSAGKLLPKAGNWMNEVKHFFGFVMLGVAIYLISKLIPGPASLILYALLTICYAVFLGALKSASTGFEKLTQGLGIALLIYGATLLIGGTMGNDSLLTPLKPGQPAVLATDATPITVTNLSDLKTRMHEARGKAIFLDFYADWCVSCKIMDKTLFQNKSVLNDLKNLLWLKVDITKNDSQSREILNHFGVIAPPTFLFFNGSGQEQKQLRVIGEVNVSTFVKAIKKALN